MCIWWSPDQPSISTGAIWTYTWTWIKQMFANEPVSNYDKTFDNEMLTVENRTKDRY